MFFGNIAELEITKDKEKANELLNNGWFLLEVKSGANDEFVFLLGRGDCPRKATMDGLRDAASVARKTV